MKLTRPGGGEHGVGALQLIPGVRPTPLRRFEGEELLTGGEAAKWHYLDASAMVKLVADDMDEEPGRATLREYYFAHGMYRATSYCVAEALSAFKTKWLRGRITQSDYVRNVREFFRLVVSALHIDEVPLAVQVHHEAERLVEAYGIDFIDSIQVVTLMAGKYSVLVGDSQSIFITADRALAAAARREGARVWECTTEGSPS